MENNENKQNVDVDSLLDKQSEAVRANFNSKNKKKFLDMDVSWIALILYGLLTFGISYAMQQTTASLSGGEIVLFVLVSFIVSFIVYNIGKILFAYICGYKLSLIEILGISFIFDTKRRVTFEFSKILEAHLCFVPNRKKENPSPRLYFFGGLIFFAIIAMAVLGISYMPLGNKMQLLLKYSIAIAAIVPLYELTPVKYSNRNDMYNFITIKTDDDKKAFNNYLINKHADLCGENLTPIQFDSYDNSRIIPWTLSSLLTQQVYQGQAADAFKTLNLLDQHQAVLSDAIICDAGYQKMYLLLTNGRSKEATDFMVILDKSLKNTEDYHPSISSLRANVLISGLIDNSLEETQDSIKDFLKACKALNNTPRCHKDLDMINSFIPRINQVHPDWKLEKITFEEVAKEPAAPKAYSASSAQAEKKTEAVKPQPTKKPTTTSSDDEY